MIHNSPEMRGVFPGQIYLILTSLQKNRKLQISSIPCLIKQSKNITKPNKSFLDIRVQLNDQLRCLDSRLESQQSQLVDIQDIFRRRAEIELTYSRDMEKLAKLVTMRHKEQRQKREGWSTFSSTDVWMQMVANTRKVGKDHAALAEIFANDIPSRCSSISEDLARIFRQVSQPARQSARGIVGLFYSVQGHWL